MIERTVGSPCHDRTFLALTHYGFCSANTGKNANEVLSYFLVVAAAWDKGSWTYSVPTITHYRKVKMQAMSSHGMRHETTDKVTTRTELRVM